MFLEIAVQKCSNPGEEWFSHTASLYSSGDFRKKYFLISLHLPDLEELLYTEKSQRVSFLLSCASQTLESHTLL